MAYYLSNETMITSAFQYDIKKNVVDKLFPNLNIDHNNVLHKYLVSIVDIIAIKFNFKLENRIKYEKQFKQNEYRDLNGLLYMLLPYIDDPEDIKKKNIKSLNDLYIAKKRNSIKNINEGEPKYEYTNIQYGRCHRNPLKERQFNLDHLKHNYVLLKETIQICANKLYINWMDVRPMDMTSYQNTELYKKTKELFDKKAIPIWDPYKDNEDGHNYGGLYIGDIYNVVTNNLYYAIKNYKWMIYDTTRVKGEFYPFIIIFNDIFKLNSCINNIEWNQLDDNYKDTFNITWKNFANAGLEGTSFKGIPHSVIFTLLISFMYFFNNKYRRVNEAVDKKEYIKLKPIEDEEEIDDENLSPKDLDKMRMSQSIKSLHPKHAYEYIKDCLESIKPTWYITMLVDVDEENKDKMYTIKSMEDYLKKYQGGQYTVDDKIVGTIQITLKNFYNFSKSLCHYTKKVNNKKSVFLPYAKYWRSLNNTTKEQMKIRINWLEDIAEVTEWFNIVGYIKKTFEEIKGGPQKGVEDAAKEINRVIYTGIRQELLNIIFENLVRNGILSFSYVISKSS